MGQLTAMKIKTLTEPGRYTDGDGLMLIVATGGARSWMLRARMTESAATSDLDR